MSSDGNIRPTIYREEGKVTLQHIPERRPYQDPLPDTENSIAITVIASLTILIILLLILTVALYLHKRRRMRNYHKYHKISTRNRPKLKISLPDKRAIDMKTKFETSQLKDDSIDDEFVIPPVTPATPEIPGTPFNPLQIHESSYGFSRSISVPAVRTLKDKDSDNIWRSAVKKATHTQLLLSKPKGVRKISHCASGKIKFSLRYNEYGQKELTVAILDFIDLPLSKETGMSVPFVKVYLYPQTAHTYHEAKNGFRLEILKYPSDDLCSFKNCPIDKLCSSALKFVILDYDRFSRSEFEADCVVLLDEVSLEGEPVTKHLSIRKIDASKDIGSLLVSLCLQPSHSRMNIVVMKANDLPATESGSSLDYFVKITLMQNDTILDKRRTHVVKKSTCPVYNENLVFPVDVGTIRSLVLICDIIRYDSKLKQEKIGSVILGNHSIHRQVTPHEIQHFNEMLTSAQRHIAEWHKLIQ